MAKEDNLVYWKKGQSGNPKGRPKKLFSTWAEEMKAEGYERVTKAHLDEALSLIINMPLVAIADLADNPDAPIGLKILASELKNEKKRGEALERILDRAFGKAALSEPSKQTELPKKIEVNIKKNED